MCAGAACCIGHSFAAAEGLFTDLEEGARKGKRYRRSEMGRSTSAGCRRA